MFQENPEEIQKEQKQNEIEVGDYGGVITAVSPMKAKAGKNGAFIVTFAIAGGDYEGCEYTFFLTHSPKAAGIRAGFYRAIGFAVPSDGCIDEKEWLGLAAKITIVRGDDGNPKIQRVSKLELNTEDTPF